MAVFGWCGCRGGCLEFDIDVPLLYGGDGPGHTRMHAYLCVPSGGTPEKVVIMVPGATQNHNYFDLNYQPEKYSFARYLRSRGYSTLLLDRLGTGKSGRPHSRKIDVLSQAVALHQVVTEAKAGRIGGATFSKIITLGHSLGVGIVATEAALYRDVDALVVSSMVHAPDAVPIAQVIYSTWMRANESTELVDNGFDDGYFTNKPPAVEPSGVDPGVAEAIRQHMDVVSTNEPQVSLFVTTPLTALINVPVLMTLGSQDPLMCGELTGLDCSTAETVKAVEEKFYSGSPAFSTFVLDGAGHDVYLDTQALVHSKAIADWLDVNTGLAGGGELFGEVFYLVGDVGPVAVGVGLIGGVFAVDVFHDFVEHGPHGVVAGGHEVAVVGGVESEPPDVIGFTGGRDVADFAVFLTLVGVGEAAVDVDVYRPGFVVVASPPGVAGVDGCVPA